MSQSSNIDTDPLSNVLTVLGARVTRRTRIEAAGEWALAFPALDRLKFIAGLRGSMWLILPHREPVRVRAGDVCLIGRTTYTVASDPGVPSVDGPTLYDDRDTVRLGGEDTTGLGGTVTFSARSADFLLDALPDFLLVSSASPASHAIRAVLAVLDAEMALERPGSAIVGARLADVLLVQAIRAYSDSGEDVRIGWLGALSDPRLGRALRAIHGDVAHPWTVASLAELAGMSRAAFSAAFARSVGQPPLRYVRTWRLTIAREALARGGSDVAGIANSVGYESQSAFALAFRSAFGASPTADALASKPPAPPVDTGKIRG